jgi:hypothetical protein
MEGKTLTLLEDLITGLDEVDAFLAATTYGLKAAPSYSKIKPRQRETKVPQNAS